MITSLTTPCHLQGTEVPMHDKGHTVIDLRTGEGFIFSSPSLPRDKKDALMLNKRGCWKNKEEVRLHRFLFFVIYITKKKYYY